MHLTALLQDAQRKRQRGGAFTDIVCDTTGMIISSIGLVYWGLVNATIGASYAAVYTLLIIFTISRNQLGAIPKITFRPKYIVYAVYIFFAFSAQNWLSEAMLVFTVAMLPFVIRDYFAIKRKL